MMGLVMSYEAWSEGGDDDLWQEYQQWVINSLEGLLQRSRQIGKWAIGINES